MSIIDRIESLFRPRRYPLAASLKLAGVDESTAKGIEQLLIDRRAGDDTRKRVAQFAAKGYAAHYDLTAILEGAPGLVPKPGETVTRLAETNRVMTWERFVRALPLPPNTGDKPRCGATSD